MSNLNRYTINMNSTDSIIQLEDHVTLKNLACGAITWTKELSFWLCRRVVQAILTIVSEKQAEHPFPFETQKSPSRVSSDLAASS